MAYADIDIEDLPASLREMVEAVGAGPVLALVELFAGQVIAIPKTKGQNYYLTRVEPSLAAWLVANWGGDTLFIPRAVRALRAVRDRELCRLYDTGTPVNALACRFHLTNRHIWRILNRPQVPRLAIPGRKQQLSLTFD